MEGWKRRHYELHVFDCARNALDVSSVKTMMMFADVSLFNGDISKWEVGSLNNMEQMSMLKI